MANFLSVCLSLENENLFFKVLENILRFIKDTEEELHTTCPQFQDTDFKIYH